MQVKDELTCLNRHTGSTVTWVKDNTIEDWLIQDFPSMLINTCYLTKHIRTWQAFNDTSSIFPASRKLKIFPNRRGYPSKDFFSQWICPLTFYMHGNFRHLQQLQQGTPQPKDTFCEDDFLLFSLGLHYDSFMPPYWKRHGAVFH